MTKMILSAALVFSLLVSSSNGVSMRHRTLERLHSGVKASCATPGTVGCPEGSYLTSGCAENTCYVDPDTQALTCDCTNGEGNTVTSTFPNAFSCNGNIINSNGQLQCSLPLSPPTHGYKTLCQGCHVNVNNLVCLHCNSNSDVKPLSDAYSCVYGVIYSGSSLQCEVSAPPTSSPTPAPQNAQPVCGGNWNPLDTPTGLEMAPSRTCNGGLFQNRQGCQMQNYCCWSNTGNYCTTPLGVPDCAAYTVNACAGFPEFCFVDATSGLCQRKCPGDQVSLCSYVN